jgi:hypothetical protein
MNEYHFLVVGLLGTAEPIIVSLDELPHVGMVLTTDTAWSGLAPEPSRA